MGCGNRFWHKSQLLRSRIEHFRKAHPTWYGVLIGLRNTVFFVLAASVALLWLMSLVCSTYGLPNSQWSTPEDIRVFSYASAIIPYTVFVFISACHTICHTMLHSDEQPSPALSFCVSCIGAGLSCVLVLSPLVRGFFY